jgi:hypothetical protein
MEEQQHTDPQTPEEAALEIGRLQVRKLELQDKAAREKKQREKLAEETRQIRFTQQLRREIASSGVGDFHLEDHELQQILAGKYKANFMIRDTGEFAVEIAGRQVPFGELVQRLAVENRNLLKDVDSIKHLTAPKDRLSRADFQTNAAKIKFIEENGLNAWEALPATSVPDATKEALTSQQYLAMTASQKVKIGLSEVEVSRLLRHGRL